MLKETDLPRFHMVSLLTTWTHLSCIGPKTEHAKASAAYTPEVTTTSHCSSSSCTSTTTPFFSIEGARLLEMDFYELLLLAQSLLLRV